MRIMCHQKIYKTSYGITSVDFDRETDTTIEATLNEYTHVEFSLCIKFQRFSFWIFQELHEPTIHIIDTFWELCKTLHPTNILALWGKIVWAELQYFRYMKWSIWNNFNEYAVCIVFLICSHYGIRIFSHSLSHPCHLFMCCALNLARIQMNNKNNNKKHIPLILFIIWLKWMKRGAANKQTSHHQLKHKK